MRSKVKVNVNVEVTSEFSLADVEYIEGIDTYVFTGNTQSDLALTTKKRSGYFEKRPNLHALLLREKTNPLVEEGRYESDVSRTHRGEFYLTYEAMTLLIECSIRNHKLKHNGLVYNSKNIFVLQNDDAKLESILKNLALKINEDAKFIVIHGIHSIPFYMRNIGGEINCLFLDTELGAPRDLFRLIQNIYPTARFYYNSARLQKDFYSCTTFAIKSVMYFAKHGAEIFPYLEQRIPADKAHAKIIALDESNLMPALLKMNQSRFELSEEVLDTLVSTKKNLTLAQYLEKYNCTINGKSYNSAALLKKYHYFEKIHKYLLKTLEKHEKIAEKNEVKLPKQLQQRHEIYSRLANQIDNTLATHLIDAYVEIQSNLDIRNQKENRSQLSPFAQTVLNEIEQKAPTFVADYFKKFSKADSDNAEEQSIEHLLFIVAYFEVKDLNHVSEYANFANKLFILFENLNDIVVYLKNYAPKSSPQAVHDLCLFNLPTKDSWDKDFWKNLVLKYGPSVTTYLALAPVIEELLEKHAQDPDLPTADIKRIKYVLKHIRYKRADEHPELAAFCLRFKRTEAHFEKNLGIIEAGFKHYDVLPDITIEGAEIDPALSQFTFSKLPVNDLRGLFLGEYSSCCQSVNKTGESCAIEGMTSIFSGFYVVYQRGEIIAQTWARIADNADFLFDSWEHVNKSQDFLGKAFILKAAEKVLAAGFNRVLIGTGGNTGDLGLQKTEVPAKFQEEAQYTDAASQYLIAENPNITAHSRFTAYAQNKISYISPLDIEKKDLAAIALGLTTLIKSKQLPWNDFLDLISFFYSHDLEILHQKSVMSEHLVQEALKGYGQLMSLLMLMKNRQELSILGVFLSFKNNTNLQLIRDCLGEFASFGLGQTSSDHGITLVCEAIKNDAVHTLEHLKNIGELEGTWDDIARIIVHNNWSLLYFAAKYNAQTTVNFLVSHCSKDVIWDLVKQVYKSPKVDTILHCLARVDNINNFSLIVNLLVQTQDEKKALDDLVLYQEGTASFKKTTTSVLVISYGTTNKAIFNYLVHFWNYRSFQSFGKMGIIKDLVRENKLNELKELYNLHCKDEDWFANLVGNDRRFSVDCPILIAHHYKFFEIINFLLDSLKQFDALHGFMLASNCGWDLRNERERDINMILLYNKVFQLYKDNKTKFIQIIRPNYFLRNVIIQNDIPLFVKALDYLVSDKDAFDKVIINIDGDRAGHSLLSTTLEHSDLRWGLVKPIVSLKTKIRFVDEVFKVCTREHLKKMLDGLRWGVCSEVEVVQHILKKIENNEWAGLAKEYATFAENGPLQAIYYSCTSIEIKSEILAFYIRVHKIDTVASNIKLFEKDVLNAILNISSLYLFQRLYQACCHDSDKLHNLYLQVIAQSTINFSREILYWFLNQNALPNEWLQSSIKENTTRALGMYRGVLYRFISITDLLWQALSQRLNKTELYAITQSIYENTQQNLIRFVVEVENKSDADIQVLKNALSTMKEMNQQMADNPKTSGPLLNSMNELLNQVGNGKLSDSFKLLCIQYTPSQRKLLLQKATQNPHISELRNYLEVIKKFEALTVMKSEVLKEYESKNSPSFFNVSRRYDSELYDLFASNELKPLYSFDTNHHLVFTQSEQINNLWEMSQINLNTEVKKLRLGY